MNAHGGNTARFAARPVSGGGTSERRWREAEIDLPDLDLAQCPALVVVGPHPDDETLGFGATAATLAARGVRVTVISVTDGGGAYPDLSDEGRARLEATRRGELSRACGVLGLPQPIRFGLPDGEISDHEDGLADRLSRVLAALPRGTWCAATWRGDGHPDHEAVGRAAAAACERAGAELLEYPVWMWHWAEPGDVAVPWERGRIARSPHVMVNRKRHAARCFRSQFDSPTSGEPILPPAVLSRLLAVDEVVFR